MASQRWPQLGGLALVLVACASPSGPGLLRGSVSDRERMALPEGAVLRVALLDVSLLDGPERVIAEQEIHPATQLPISFALGFDRAMIESGHRYALRATIADNDGRVQWATAAAQPVLTQGAPETAALVVQRLREGSQPSGPRLFAYACDGFAFRVEVRSERALLFLPGRGNLTLPAARAASGAKYTDGTALYWSKGDEALLTLDGVEYTGCHIEPLRAP